ncbi:MAG: hypothetical protein LBB89_09105 [Treponema sp.]|jgi:hypothetical protein|nr:hypothetical protein [Treponema sp.]
MRPLRLVSIVTGGSIYLVTLVVGGNRAAQGGSAGAAKTLWGSSTEQTRE